MSRGHDEDVPLFDGMTANRQNDHPPEYDDRNDDDFLGKLDFDDYLHYLISLETLTSIVLILLLCLVFVRGKYDASFWAVMSFTIAVILFYIYWKCIRSPSQYYALSSTIYPFAQRERSNGNLANNEAMRTTGDIIDTTSYQSRPAFGQQRSSVSIA